MVIFMYLEMAGRGRSTLIGLDAIARYMGLSGIGSNKTLLRWVEEHEFPALKCPDGVWCSSVAAIDDWIFLMAEVQRDKRARGEVIVSRKTAGQVAAARKRWGK